MNLSDAVHNINRNDTFKYFVDDLESETNQYVKIDVEVMFKYIDNIINELDTRSINFSTIVSGIIGGIIGSISTIILTIVN